MKSIFANFNTFSHHQRRITTLLIPALGLVVTGIVCLEDNQAGIFLSARNFPPHSYNNVEFVQPSPYSIVPAPGGPVIFTKSAAIGAQDHPLGHNNDNRVIPYGHDNFGNHHHFPATDSHPYAQVARKYQRIVAGRFNQNGYYQDNHVSPQVYTGLSNHALKVLGKPHLGSAYPPAYSKPKNYAFSYKVLDHVTGDDFSHTQSQHSGSTNGEYRVKLPDGRIQIVSYKADENGYKADVRYTFDNENVGLPPPAPSPTPIVLHNFELIPKIGQNGGDQRYFPRDQTRYIYATAVPKTINDYAAPPPPPQTYQTAGSADGTTNKFPGYLSATIAPFVVRVADEDYPDIALSSTVAPPATPAGALQGFRPVLLNKPYGR